MHSHLSLKHRTHKGDDNQKVSKGKRWNLSQARRPRRFGAGVAVGGPAGPALWAHSHPAARAERVLPHQMDCHGCTGSRLSLSYQLEAGMGTLRAFGAQYRLTWWLNGGFFRAHGHWSSSARPAGLQAAPWALLRQRQRRLTRLFLLRRIFPHRIGVLRLDLDMRERKTWHSRGLDARDGDAPVAVFEPFSKATDD